MVINQKVLGFVLIVFLVGLLWLFITSLISASPGITAAIIAGVVAISGAIYTHTQTRIREIKARHFIEKKKVYMDFIDLLFHFLRNFENKQKIESEEVAGRILIRP